MRRYWSATLISCARDGYSTSNSAWFHATECRRARPLRFFKPVAASVSTGSGAAPSSATPAQAQGGGTHIRRNQNNTSTHKVMFTRMTWKHPTHTLTHKHDSTRGEGKSGNLQTTAHTKRGTTVRRRTLGLVGGDPVEDATRRGLRHRAALLNLTLNLHTHTHTHMSGWGMQCVRASECVSVCGVATSRSSASREARSSPRVCWLQMRSGSAWSCTHTRKHTCNNKRQSHTRRNTAGNENTHTRT